MRGAELSLAFTVHLMCANACALLTRMGLCSPHLCRTRVVWRVNLWRTDCRVCHSYIQTLLLWQTMYKCIAMLINGMLMY